jgi:L-alanine-DL-glutamate epimerase-like enolase superfamily enzyme
MKIVDVVEETRPIKSNIRNAYIDFSKMTLSLVAVVTDVVRDGDLFQPYGGFPDDVRVEDGHVTLPDLPGIGFEGKADLINEMRALAH